MIFLGGMQTEDFCGFLSLMFDREDININEVDHVLLMDNCKSHKNDFTFGTLYHKYPIIYNAPYTPQFNAIEEVFSWIKGFVRA